MKRMDLIAGVVGAAVVVFFAVDAGRQIYETIYGAFPLISVFMNVFFAPGMMLTHHLTDVYIADHGGSFPLRGIPTAYRTIFAAALSVALGLFLGIAARTKERNDGQRARSRPR